MLLAHGGTAGFVVEVAALVVPILIVFYFLNRTGRSDEDEEE